jgi:hypothetical protein
MSTSASTTLSRRAPLSTARVMAISETSFKTSCVVLSVVGRTVSTEPETRAIAVGDINM